MERPAFLAGAWYPADERSCRASIEAHAAGAPGATGGAHRGLIGPHAGFAFSGDCAAHTYSLLAAEHASAELAVVFGSHRGPSGPYTVFLADAWGTPLGPLANDTALAADLARELSLDEEPVEPARPDNGVELHLPLVRFFFPRARLLVVGVGASEIAGHIGRRVGELAREAGRDAVFIGSTDLTHYGPSYGLAPAGAGEQAVRWVRETNDRGFLDAVLRGDPKGALAHAAEHESACCPGAAAAALEAVHAYAGACTPALVEHYLSYDVRPASSFVGYAGVVI